MVASFLSALAFAFAISETSQDTLKTVSLDEINVISYIKETGTLRQQPASTTYLSNFQLTNNGASGIKSIGTLAPNLFMPDYGSKQTSAIYMRGVGSRIGTPSVGLYVDNVAYYEKTAFDVSLFDVESIDILRGPQSSLYGRNAMGGLIRIHTRNPFIYNGTDIRLGYATKNNQRQVSASHYLHLNEKLALSFGGFYDGNDGFFRNETLDKKADGSESGGGRIRAIFKANNRLTFDANVSYEYSDEGAYPYFYTGAVSGDEQYGDLIGKISANLDGNYRRGMLNASVNTEYKTDAITFNSVTAFQNINDRMFMDQDFLNVDIYSLEQKQKINILSEELLLKNNGRKTWNWLVGVNMFHEWQNIKAPVTFREDGMKFLNDMIKKKMSIAPMPMSVMLTDKELRFENNFDTPTSGLALFHQSTFNVSDTGLSFALGLRLDYEANRFNYYAWDAFAHNFVMPSMKINKTYDVNYNGNGELNNDYIQFLPKFSAKYDFKYGNAYATISRGYRSGGYNPQNISEVMRTEMIGSIITNVRDEISPILPPVVKDKVIGILDNLIEHPDVEGTCSYKPEYAWNYEIGTHLNLLDRTLTMDFSAFISEISDLQLSKMSATGLGRTIHNAGKSRSTGVEMAMRYHPIKDLSLGLAYGFTHATFRDYAIYEQNSNPENSEDKIKTIDCNGNYVPYIPSSTLNIDAAYAFQINKGILKTLTIGADYSLAGKIYWDEQNLHSQNSYGILGAHLQFAFNNFNVQLWGRNLTNTKYNTFWFESMGRGFEQHGKPIQFGATVSLHL